jgi:hypothetical protein
LNFAVQPTNAPFVAKVQDFALIRRGVLSDNLGQKKGGSSDFGNLKLDSDSNVCQMLTHDKCHETKDENHRSKKDPEESSNFDLLLNGEKHYDSSDRSWCCTLPCAGRRAVSFAESTQILEDIFGRDDDDDDGVAANDANDDTNNAHTTSDV